MHPATKAVWEAVPKPIRDVVATAIDRAQGGTVPPPPRIPTASPIRLLIGPTNYAGQGYRWGRALEANPDIISRNMITSEINGFGYNVDYEVRWRTSTHSRAWQRELLAAITSDYTHVLIEAEMPLLGGMYNHSVRRQVAELRRHGTKVGMVCHGTDIRLPSRHRTLEPWSPFANNDWVPVQRFEKAVLKNRALLDDVAAPTFVSTPGLLLDVPYARLLPVVIDPDNWANSQPVLQREKLRVVHVPSNPLPKGTVHIEPVLRRMHDEGLIEYVRAIGLTQSDMPGLFASADIVLDQFRVGDYGVGACEAMAAGRLVVSHVSDQVRAVVKADAGRDLPIVEATIESLEGVLRDVHFRRNHYHTLAAEGPEFVRTMHDGRMARSVLEQHFLMV